MLDPEYRRSDEVLQAHARQDERKPLEIKVGRSSAMALLFCYFAACTRETRLRSMQALRFDVVQDAAIE